MQNRPQRLERRREPAPAAGTPSAEQMARLAHELSSPLSVVMGSLAALEQEVETLAQGMELGTPMEGLAPRVEAADRAEALFRLCRDATRRLEHVVRELRTFGRPQVIGPQSVDLGQVLRQAVRLALPDPAGRGCIDLDLPDDLVPVSGVAESLGQVFFNLLRNALEATAARADGRVWIRARELGVECRWLEVSVRDNGPGVAPAIRRRLFQPFQSTKQSGGMGLGLAISHDLVARHGGSLTLLPGDSGTEFVVRLPAAKRRVFDPRAAVE